MDEWRMRLRDFKILKEHVTRTKEEVTLATQNFYYRSPVLFLCNHDPCYPSHMVNRTSQPRKNTWSSEEPDTDLATTDTEASAPANSGPDTEPFEESSTNDGEPSGFNPLVENKESNKEFSPEVLHDVGTGPFPLELHAKLSPVNSSSSLLPAADDETDEKSVESEGKRVKRNRIRDTRRRVDKLTEKVRESVQLLMERGDAIEDLNERAHNLLTESFQFKKTTKTLRKRLWLKNVKIMVGVTVGIVVLVIVLLIAFLPQSRAAINTYTRASK